MNSQTVDRFILQWCHTHVGCIKCIVVDYQSLKSKCVMFERNNSFEWRKSSSLYPLARGQETNARYRCSRTCNNLDHVFPERKQLQPMVSIHCSSQLFQTKLGFWSKQEFILQSIMITTVDSAQAVDVTKHDCLTVASPCTRKQFIQIFSLTVGWHF